MTLALMRCEFVDVIYLFLFLFFSSVVFPHAVFIVRKLTVISIAPIEYCLAHLLTLLNCIDVHFCYTVGLHVISIFYFTFYFIIIFYIYFYT